MLIKCPHCQCPVSSEENICPICGKPVHAAAGDPAPAPAVEPAPVSAESPAPAPAAEPVLHRPAPGNGGAAQGVPAGGQIPARSPAAGAYVPPQSSPQPFGPVERERLKVAAGMSRNLSVGMARRAKRCLVVFLIAAVLAAAAAVVMILSNIKAEQNKVSEERVAMTAEEVPVWSESLAPGEFARVRIVSCTNSYESYTTYTSGARRVTTSSSKKYLLTVQDEAGQTYFLTFNGGSDMDSALRAKLPDLVWIGSSPMIPAGGIEVIGVYRLISSVLSPSSYDSASDRTMAQELVNSGHPCIDLNETSPYRIVSHGDAAAHSRYASISGWALIVLIAAAITAVVSLTKMLNARKQKNRAEKDANRYQALLDSTTGNTPLS